jgi:hypothetical protein
MKRKESRRQRRSILGRVATRAWSRGDRSTQTRRPRFEPLEERRLLAITVNTALDELDNSIIDGDISLRDAIAAAPIGETINFAPALNGQTITLTLGELVLDKSVKIDASGLADGLTIDASGNDLTPTVDKGDGSRVFRITDELPGAIAVELHGLTLTGGDVSGNGGAVLFRRAGSLTITGSTLTGNSATAGGGLWARTIDSGSVRLLTSTVSGNASKSKAGGVYADAANNGTLEIRDSTISGNTAASDGGGAYTRGTVSVLQNTISGNSANWRGGGVFAFSGAGATTTIRFSTITANTADADANNPVTETGGGVFAGGAGTLKIDHTIVAANTDRGDHAHDLKFSAGILDARYNLIGKNGGSSLAPAPIAAPDAKGNIVGSATAISPGLAPLADNGGPTLTHALLTTSAAVNAGDPTFTPGSAILGVPQWDQRGASILRVDEGPGGPNHFRIDIGAYELTDAVVDSVMVDSLADEEDGDTSPGKFSLREAMRLVHELDPAGTRTITFASSLAGGTIPLSMGYFQITRNLVIDASSLNGGIRIDGQGLSGHFSTRANVKFQGLTLSGASDGAIGVLWQNTTVEVNDCIIENGAGALFTAGNLKIVGTTIRNNTGGRGVAISAIAHSSVDIIDSQIVDNVGTHPSGIGGAISHNQARVSIIRSTISGNMGGGIASEGPLTINQSTIADNIGPGIASIQGAFGMAITDSAIVNNAGIGIQAHHAGALNITNATISNNGGGGIRQNYFFATVDIRHSTIAQNNGTGVYTEVETKVSNSIISGNTAPTGSEQDFLSTKTPILRYSLIGRDNPNNGVLTGVGMIVGTDNNPVDAKLGPLANNGGPTLTHTLLPGSVAINAGDPALVAGQGSTPEFDQRGTGFGRIATGRIDMGAVEAGATLNTPPTITSPSNVSVPENSSTALTITVDDPDLPPQTMAFTITGGADAAKFTIASNGTLSFKAAPDYEAPDDAGGDRTYLVDIRVEDGVGGFDTQSLSITITPVNDHNPIFQSPDKANVVEGSVLIMPVTANDADLPAQPITFSIFGGDDAAKFDISPDGVLSFVQPPSFDAPTDANGDNVYEVTVQASDGAGGTTTQAISVTVSSSDPPPPVNADFNGDGFVTGADLAIWRENFGTIGGPDPTPGDADHDRDVDGADFLIWQRSLGQAAPPAAAAVSFTATEAEASANSDQAGLALGKNVILNGSVVAIASPIVPVTTRTARDATGDAAPRPGYRPASLLVGKPAPMPAWPDGESPASSHADWDAVFEDHALLDEIVTRLV